MQSIWTIYSHGDLQVHSLMESVSENTSDDNEMIKGVLREIANIENQTKRKIVSAAEKESFSTESQSPSTETPNTPIADGNRPPIIGNNQASAPRPNSPSTPTDRTKSSRKSPSSMAKANSGSVKRKTRKSDISKREPMREPTRETNASPREKEDTPRRRTRRQHFEETFRLEEVIKIQVAEEDDDEEIDIC